MSHAVSFDGDEEPGSYAAKQRTILISLIIDFVLWIPDIVAAILSGSIVLFADAVKCGNEIIATFLAYLTIRKMAKGGVGVYDYGMGKMETITSVITGGVMFISLMIVFVVALYRIAVPGELVHEGVMLGIILMVIGVSMNSYLWLKNYRFNQRDPSPIMDSQWKLFRTKAFSDFTVLVSLMLLWSCLPTAGPCILIRLPPL
ncbi:MAG: cation transporter [Methanomicrobiales archaeon]